MLHFTDSNVVKATLISGVSSSASSRELLWQIADLELDLLGRTWISRVPSESNLADPPSRLRWEELLPIHDAVLDEPLWPRMNIGEINRAMRTAPADP